MTEAIAYIQRRLNDRGAGLKEDAVWGPATRAAFDAAIGEAEPVINAAGLALIKEFEGFRAAAYLDPVGIVTIGYGTTAAAGVGITPRLGMTISEAEASGYLLRALDTFAATIRPAVIGKPTPNQWAAMLSLAYNIGPEAFRRSSVLRLFNAGDTAGAADAFRLWNKAGGRVLPGLVRRREAERALFSA